MPLWLFNPPEPSASPTYRPERGERGQSLCGGARGFCDNVPPYWQIITIGAQAPFDIFNGTIVVGRDLGPNWELDALCHWGAVVKVIDPAESAVALLTYTDINLAAGGEGGFTDWCVQFGFTDTGIEVIYNQASVEKPNTMFRCCTANTMAQFQDASNSFFPPTILVQPFWP